MRSGEVVKEQVNISHLDLHRVVSSVELSLTLSSNSG